MLLLASATSSAGFEVINGTVSGAWRGVAPCLAKSDANFDVLRLQFVARGYDPFGGNHSTQAWSRTELNEVAQAFGDLPSSIFPLDEQTRVLLHHHTNHHLAQVQTQHRFKVAARAGEGLDGIQIDGGWHEVGAHERRAILVHEIAHEFIRTRGRTINWGDIWKEAAAADAKAAGGGTSFASAYAGVSIDEDFAESFTAYRYAPALLKGRAPNRYALLRVWAFDELEYHAASRCAPEAAKSARVGQIALGQLAHATLSAADSKRIASRCRTSKEPIHCAEEGVFVTAYRRAWEAEPTTHPAASIAALGALMRNDGFIHRSIDSAPADVRANIARMAAGAMN